MSESIVLELECCVCGSNCSAHSTVGYIGRGRWVEGKIENPHDSPFLDVSSVKSQRAICEECFIQDDDLCRFFEKIGMRVR